MPTDEPNPARPPGGPATLAERVACGDARAFAHVHASLAPGLRAMFLRRLGQRADVADDLAQQTWAAVWDALRRGRYDPTRAAVSTFIYAVAHNMWLRFCRAARRGLPTEAAVPPDLGPSPERMLAYCELLEALRGCLRNPHGDDALSAEERQIVLAAADGQSERELARQLGVAASTINARKKAAYGKIRRCLAHKGYAGEFIEQFDLLSE